MIDPGRIISYVAISIILLFGIAIVSGLFLEFDLKMRIGIGIVIALYVIIRVKIMTHKSKPRSMLRYRDTGED
ncbi:MAG: hypothetical protein KKG33_05205 [candidate division Zixibacteria bacterium]|nr:hypothetical protein [candidate division Zixibacteria bacterium]MBU1471239.1 hypothetical protein [candidate division Zixibacteria bacterium]MBU2624941.1 hypothetical protein [candidate division Zixibacteria bacterium]